MEPVMRTMSVSHECFTGSLAERMKALSTPGLGDSVVHRPSISEVSRLGSTTVTSKESFHKPADGLEFSLERHRLAYGGRSKSYPRRPDKDSVVAGRTSVANMGYFTDASTSMEQNYPRILPPPSLTAGSSLNSSLGPLTPTISEASLITKTGDSGTQHRIPIRTLPSLPEELGQEPNNEGSDAVDRVTIKVEGDFKSREIGHDEVATSDVRNWLDQIDHVAETKTSTSTSDLGEDRDNVILPILDALRNNLIDRIMDEFRLKFDQRWEAQATQCAGKSPNSSGESDTGDTPEGTVSSNAQSVFPGKRQRFEEDEIPDENGNKKPRRQPNVSGSSKGLKSRVKFACPFRKHDPQKYSMYNHRVCALTHWDTIARVKEHLYRNHKTAPYCRRCWRVFETEELLDSHATVPATSICEVLQGQPPDGVTPKQVTVLKSKARPYSDQSEEDRWRHIYRLLFPGEIVPSPYWEPVQEQGRLSPDFQNLTHYDGYMLRELPSLFRSRIQELIRREMQPVEASLMASLDFAGLIRECQDQLSREYRAADVREGCLEAAQSEHRVIAVLASQSTAESLSTAVTQQPAVVPPTTHPRDQDNFGHEFSTLDEEVFGSQTQKQTSDTGSGSDPGYASGRLCECSGSCSCLGWSMVSTSENVGHTDSLAAGVVQSQQDGVEGQTVQWQSWMESQDWDLDS